MIAARKKALERQVAELHSIRVMWDKMKIKDVSMQHITSFTVRLHQVDLKLGKLQTYTNFRVRNAVRQGRL